MAASTSLTPEQRRERARNAGKAAQSLETYINVLVRRAPELTEVQAERLRGVIGQAEQHNACEHCKAGA